MKRHLVLVTFDLIKERDTNLYPRITRALKGLGLEKYALTRAGVRARLPYNTYAGNFPSKRSRGLRERLEGQVRDVLNNQGVRARFFIVAASRWSWSKGLVKS